MIRLIKSYLKLKRIENYTGKLYIPIGSYKTDPIYKRLPNVNNISNNWTMINWIFVTSFSGLMGAQIGSLKCASYLYENAPKGSDLDLIVHGQMNELNKVTTERLRKQKENRKRLE